MKFRFGLLIGAALALTVMSACSDEADSGPGETITSLVSYDLPSSTTQNPISTWWGYNQTKIVRRGSNIYYGIIEGDSGAQNSTANFKVYKRADGVSPQLVATLVTSRPGNVVIDHSGRLHVFVFEPLDASVNDSIGDLVHYQYDGVEAGTFTLTARTVIKASPSQSTEAVNIRIGASTNSSDDLAVAYGLYSDPSDSSHAEYLFTKTGSGSWVEKKVTNQPHEFYYPFVVIDDAAKATILAVQDDYVAGPPAFNRYYKINLFTVTGSTWTSTNLMDLSNDPLAQNDSKPQLAEQSELFEKTNGEILVIYKDKRNENAKFRLRTIATNGTVSSESNLDWAEGMNWVRAFEYNSEVYFIAVDYDSAYAVKASSGVAKKINLPGFQTGTYPYLSSARGGDDRNAESKIDFYMITGNSANYPNPGSRLYQMPKSSIAQLF